VTPLRGRASAVAVVVAALGCGGSGRPVLDRVPSGTWGGEDAGLVVGADGAHAHVGCTAGDIEGEIALDGEGRFDVPGTYDVDAFPVSRGIVHPARFTGRTDGRRLSFTVRLTDNGQTLSSGDLVLGREPRMRSCPICARPGRTIRREATASSRAR
jgi:hypothetical protein